MADNKETEKPPQPGFNPQPQPPPYSEIAPPHSIPPAAAVQPITIPFYSQNDHHHHLGHYGPQPIVQSHIITRQPGATIHVVASSQQLLGANPTTIVCSRCNHTVSSKIIHEPSLRTHVLALSLCLLGCWPCVPCVYCAECCTNVNHYCPRCNSYQGTFIQTY